MSLKKRLTDSFSPKAAAYGSIESNQQAASQINEWDADPISTNALLGIGKRSQRQRDQIYTKWQYMLGDAVISSALKLHCTAALGGHETTQQLVFIEIKPEYKKDAAKVKIVQEMAAHLTPIFNKTAFTVAYNAAGYGDAYSRIYSEKGYGIVDLVCDEMMLPPLVQAYEKGSQTVGFVVGGGTTFNQRLTLMQMARAKMPRANYIPQSRALDKALKMALAEDDVSKLPVLPSLVGGSFLDGAEDAYDNMTATLTSMVGQRIIDSIDETLFAVNMESMTKEQRTRFTANIKTIFAKSKEYAEKAVKEGRPRLGRIRHFLPTYNEKQITNITAQLNGNRGSQISVEDFMVHAKLLGGAMAIDISMIGFADLLSGGLGDGGFYRVSMQAGEKSRQLRGALSEHYNHCCDVHLFQKSKLQIAPKDRFWDIHFYGGQLALEREKTENKNIAIQTASMVVAILQQLKDLGLSDIAINHFLTHEMLFTQEEADIYTTALKESKPVGNEEGM